MNDINKEREAFEALPEIKPHLDHGNVQWSDEYKTYVSDFKSLHIVVCYVRGAWFGWQEKAKAQTVPQWINVEVGVPVKFGTRVKIKRKSWDEEDNLIFVESEATYDKDSDFCELSNRTHEYETWFDHELKKYLEEDEITHWAPLDKTGNSGAQQ